MTARRPFRTRTTVPLALATVAGLLAAVPVHAATATPCVMTATIHRTASRLYKSGVQRNTYNVKVTWSGHDEQASVQRLLMPKGTRPRLMTEQLGSLGPVHQQLSSRNTTRGIAAVNGDYFYGYRINGRSVYLPRSASISHSQAVRLGPAGTGGTGVIGVDAKGHPFDGRVAANGTLVHGSTTFAVTGVNWQEIGSTDVVEYTRRWADVSDAPRPTGSVEWVVQHNTIAAVLTGSKMGKSVQVGTKVVAFGSHWASQAAAATVGSQAKLSVPPPTTPTGVPITEAVGRGPSLVTGGQVVMLCTPKRYEQRPRTTVGWNAHHRWMALVIPGTGYTSWGYRIGGLGTPQEANVAKALGFVEAVALDGGGSTTAYMRARGTWHRIDDKAGAYERSIPNSLLFVRPR